jgi:ketopantoate reductase
MHLDFQNKKRNELETLSGFIVQSAKKYDIKVPLMQKMYNELLVKSNLEVQS